MTEPDLVQTPEDERISDIVQRVPAIAAIAAELEDKRDQWCPGVHRHDTDLNLAGLIAYQSMAAYPPRTFNELALWVLGVLPDAVFDEDSQGQIVINTGLQVASEGPETLEKMSELPQ